MTLKSIFTILLEHPLLIFGAVGAASSVIARPGALQVGGRKLARLGVIVTFITLFLMLATAVVYCTSWFFLDHAEPMVACISWLFTTGQTVYPDANDAQRYGSLYGPMLWFAYGVPMKLVAASVPVAKIVAAIMTFSAIGFTYASAKSFGARASLAALVYVTLTFAYYGDLIFWVRADELLMFVAALGLFGAARLNKIAAAIVCGMALGIAANTKVHASLYFVPIYFILLKRHGFKCALMAAAVSAFVAAAPFVLFSNVSLKHYVVWIRQAAHHAPELEIFVRNVETVILLFAPLAAAALLIRTFDWWREWRATLISLFCCVCLIGVLASKGGSGPWHFLPFVPTIAFAVASAMARLAELREDAGIARRRLSLATSIVVGFVAVTMFRMSVKDLRAIQRVLHYPAAESVAEIRSIMRDHEGKFVAVGPGGDGDYQGAWFRTVPVLAGHPLVIDTVAVMDHKYAGATFPESATRALAGGVYECWIVPKGAKPFSLMTYFVDEPLFDESVIAAFHRAYRLSAESERYRQYDVWIRRE